MPPQWIIRGNVVVATGNPFAQENNKNNDDGSSILWLGPGLKILMDHIVVVDHLGIITKIEPSHEYNNKKRKNDNNDTHDYIELDNRTEFLCPGFIDTHIHAPQYSFTGTATDLPLMGPQGWLESYTFPAESAVVSDAKRAHDVFSGVVKTTLRHGTTTALYWGGVHLQPCKTLVDIVVKYGQRALVGKPCMDRNVDYKDSCHTMQQNLNDTSELIDYILTKARANSNNSDKQQQQLPLVMPVVTPRFIPTCSQPLLKALGEMAETKYENCHITSHASESCDAVEYSKQLDIADSGGTGRTDSEVLKEYKLLTSKSIYAHCNHLKDADVERFIEMGAAIAHCPLSNMFFAGQTLPCKKLLKKGVKIGLATDVAGGYSPSMLNACQATVIASNGLQHQNNKLGLNNDDDDDAVLNYKHAFYLGTLGSAEALSLDHRIGTIKVGMEFDAFIMSAKPVPSSYSPVEVFDADTIADIFQKICNLGDDRNIKRVFVQGKDVTVRD